MVVVFARGRLKEQTERADWSTPMGGVCLAKCGKCGTVCGARTARIRVDRPNVQELVSGGEQVVRSVSLLTSDSSSNLPDTR